jgi:S-adenosylmethionine hydrolase
MNKIKTLISFADAVWHRLAIPFAQNKIIVYQSDFGLKDGAVSEMKGVAIGVSPDLKLYDLTHEIPNYNIWEASYRLYPNHQLLAQRERCLFRWLTPGVGTFRKSIVLKTNTGQFIVTPDNGTLTLVAQTYGIAGIREIDEVKNRRPGSGKSYTFHGRDVYSYTAARLAAGVITFEQVGPELPKQVVSILYQQSVFEGGKLKGTIDIHDVQYGNIWTDIGEGLVKQLNPKYGDLLHLKIFNKGKFWYMRAMRPYSETFGSVPEGKPLAYLNSLLQLSFALNMGSFADAYKIGSGCDWSVEVTKK